MNVRIAFEKLYGVTTDETRKWKIKPEYEHVNINMIFDINMDGKYTRKEILVADRQTTALLSSITYSSVVSRDSVRIAFKLESLNDLDIFSCDIGNEKLDYKCRDKPWK